MEELDEDENQAKEEREGGKAGRMDSTVEAASVGFHVASYVD